MNAKPFFISIEGNIGAGKTTLAKLLAKKLSASLLLEKFEENPHLKKFYKNPNDKQLASDVEHWFANERVKQMSAFFKNRQNRIIVSDYHIEKCLVFAKINIGQKGVASVSKILKPTLPKPDVIIYLHRDIKELVKSIQNRGRNYEQKIKEDYLIKIEREYLLLLSKWKKASGKKIHFIKSEEGSEELLKKTLKQLKLTICP